jgi:hypothetical protein
MSPRSLRVVVGTLVLLFIAATWLFADVAPRAASQFPTGNALPVGGAQSTAAPQSHAPSSAATATPSAPLQQVVPSSAQVRYSAPLPPVAGEAAVPAGDVSGTPNSDVVLSGVKLFPTKDEARFSENLGVALNEADAKLKPCLQDTEEAKAGALPDGGFPMVTLKFTIVDNAGTGRVRNMQVVDSDFRHPAISHCLAVAVQGLILPPPQGRPESEITLQVNAL